MQTLLNLTSFAVTLLALIAMFNGEIILSVLMIVVARLFAIEGRLIK